MDARPVSADEAAGYFKPLSRHPRIALAVSGGPDSLALLHLVADWRTTREGEPRVTVLTVDHGLRVGSRGEAEMVAEVAAGRGLAHAVLTWTKPDGASAKLQERAREARYDMMAAYCLAHDIAALVTAHHLDDQAETFLMRLKRGSGLDGLAAIPEESLRAGIAVLRPLLDLPKARLVATLRARGVAWVDDPSNADERFERVRVRSDRDALAALGFEPASLARSAKRLRRARAALERSADDFLASHASVSEAGFCTVEPNALADAPAEIALRALARVLASVGGRAEPVRLSKLEALLAALQGEPGKTHTLGGCRIAPIGKSLGIFRETRGTGLPELVLEPGQRALWDNRFRVELGAREPHPVIVRALGKDAAGEAPVSLPWFSALPRFARITLPACFRDGALILPRLGNIEPEAMGLGFRANFVGARGVPILPAPD